MDLIDQFDRASAWTASKISAAADQLDKPTPCSEWNVRALVSHLIGVQQLFQSGARGEQISGPPQGAPEDVVGDDPAGQFEQARQQTLAAFREPGALEKAGMLAGIAVTDTLIHGWDLAKATGQDTAMPADLAESAFGMMNGNLPPERRGNSFAPEVSVPDDASTQDKLLGYMGRDPS